MHSTTTSAVIDHLTDFIYLKGTPEEVFTDNGQPFKSCEWHQFAKKHDFKHTISIPYYPQANVFIEGYMKTMKLAITKAKATKISISEVLIKIEAKSDYQKST